MTSVVPAYEKTIKYKDVTIEGVTFSANGAAGISSHKPAGMNHFLFAILKDWGAGSPAAAITVMADGSYIMGSANQSISYVIIRYFYTD